MRHSSYPFTGPPDSWYDPPEPPPEVECEQCGAEVYPGNLCGSCGWPCPEELTRAEWEADHADDLRDAAMDRAAMEDAEDPYEGYE